MASMIFDINHLLLLENIGKWKFSQEKEEK
jgi:hypothetical protein